ncbi:F15O4.15 [Arabidopsis thaliana]|uniref:F15O4.15 n=1 Tax=Arabidopsis thaliana TaxID=3702 RepID=Q9LQH0_ARATH|nr:F15O4.15 [Arabidopsis thaliana]
METTFGGRTKPVTIASDETMGVFLAMRFELEDLSLFVSKQTVDGGSEDGGTSQTSSYGFADKGKSPLYVNAERSPNYESVVWKRLMHDEAVLRWMRSTETEGQNVGDSSTNVQQHPVRPAVKAASPMLTTESMDTATEDGDQEEYSTVVEADLLKNLGLPSINLATESYDSLSEGEAYNDENDYPGGETIKECNFFGPSATNLVEPLGVHLDLAVPLHEALEDMCLNFASFNRDAAPTLDEQGEEGTNDIAYRVGMELAIRDVVYEGDELFVGRVFKNKQDCNVKLAVHALNRRFYFRRDRSCKKLTTLTCISETCPWRVYIVKLEDSDNYQIRSANLEHTCTVEEKSNYHRAATTRVIGSIFQSKYAGNSRGPRAIDLQCILLTDYSVRIFYWKAWKSREIAMDSAQGSAANSFTLLPAYLHVLREANPGSIVDLKTEVDGKGNHRFKYMFLAFAASIQGFSCMKRVIVIDGAHLKGKYGGCLLTASGQDANFQVYPKAKHGACIVHLQRNIATSYKKKHLLFHVPRAARAFRIFLKEARELPIISLLEFIRTTLISWFAMRREAARTEASPLPPKMREVVHRNFEKSVRFAVHRLDRYDYEIREEGASVYHVKLMEHTCSCRAFDLLHLPCPHAITAAVVEGVPIQGLMAPEYSVESWRMSYLGTIKPVPEVGDVFALPEPIASLHLFPPATRRPSGQPKKKRITSRGEFTGPQRQVTRCSRCTGSDHNRATCKMPI